MPVRTMPAAPEAEASLLGTMMVYPRAAQVAIEEGLLEEDFYIERNRQIFKAIQSLYQEGETVDITTVATRLQDINLMDHVGGLAYLTDLSEAAVTSANTKTYVHIVRDKALTRKMIEAAQEISEDGYGGQADINDYLDIAEKKVLEISRERRTGEFYTSPQIFNDVAKKIREMSENKSSITGLATGFKRFDEITHGFQKGDLVILAARPSMGKTAVALNFALQVAQRNRQAGAIAIFSLEMSVEQLGLRLLAAKSRVNGDNLRTGRLNNDQWNAVNEAIVDLKTLKLYIDFASQIKVSEMFSKCRRLQADQGLSMVIVDYIQLIQGANQNRENRQQEVSDISRSLKALARELNVPVLALSQLSRNVESRENKRPMLSDLRESGAIEQDADIVMMLYRDSPYNEEAKRIAVETNSEKIEINIAKHRNGQTDKFDLAFEPSTNFIMNYAGSDEGQR